MIMQKFHTFMQNAKFFLKRQNVQFIFLLSQSLRKLAILIVLPSMFVFAQSAGRQKEVIDETGVQLVYGFKSPSPTIIVVSHF